MTWLERVVVMVWGDQTMEKTKGASLYGTNAGPVLHHEASWHHRQKKFNPFLDFTRHIFKCRATPAQRRTPLLTRTSSGSRDVSFLVQWVPPLCETKAPMADRR